MCCVLCCARRRRRRLRALRASQCAGASANANANANDVGVNVDNNNNSGNSDNNNTNNNNGNNVNNNNNSGNRSTVVNLPSVTTINVTRPVYAVSPASSGFTLQQPLIEVPSEDMGAQEQQQSVEAANLSESEGLLPTQLDSDDHGEGLPPMPSEAILMMDDEVITHAEEMEGEVVEPKPAGFFSRLLGQNKSSNYQRVN